MNDTKYKPIANEISLKQREKSLRNARQNEEIKLNYMKLLANGIVTKSLTQQEVSAMRERVKRLDNCNKFWLTETYEINHVKVLLRTFLCKDRFCVNCNQIKKALLQKRFLPYIEQYKSSLYHLALTVPNCNGKNLRKTIQHMIYCFKTLVTYLNGNKKVKGIDLLQYGFQGCVRSLEITYQGDDYHPHFHVAAVFNSAPIEEKHIYNQFSKGVELFTDFKSVIQKIWWLLINNQRLSYGNIFVDNNCPERYSCTINKVKPEDFHRLFGYMLKNYDNNNTPMNYNNFKNVYYALSHIRQIQGYGIFYNLKALNTDICTETEYQAIENYILYEEKPSHSYEPLSLLATDRQYIMIRTRHK